jgi:hypothetical protein
MNTPIDLWDRSLKFPGDGGTTVPATEDRRKVPQCLGSASVYRWTETGRQDTYCSELTLLTVNKYHVAVSTSGVISSFAAACLTLSRSWPGSPMLSVAIALFCSFGLTWHNQCFCQREQYSQRLDAGDLYNLGRNLPHWKYIHLRTRNFFPARDSHL